MKRAALYSRVSTYDQNPQTQILDLRQMAAQRGYTIVKEYTDKISGLKDSTSVEIRWSWIRESIDTAGPLGRAIVVIIGAIAELERSLIVERERAGIRRARLEGQHIGRNPLVLDNLAIQRDRQHGQSIRQIAKGHRVSTATVQRVLRKLPPQTQGLEALDKTARTRPLRPVTKGSKNPPASLNKTNGRTSTIRPCQKVWVQKRALRSHLQKIIVRMITHSYGVSRGVIRG
jgi:DNA invertase Pin-like site-specific DNA recombinase